MKLFAFVLSLLLAAPMVQANDQDKVVALVEKTHTAFKANPAEVIGKINNPDNAEFRDGSLYMFAYDMEGVLLAIGFKVGAPPIGKSRIDLKDPDGKELIKGLRDLAKEKGKGWYDYKYLNPANKQIETKTSYIIRVDLKPDQAKAIGSSTNSVWIGAGTYKAAQ